MSMIRAAYKADKQIEKDNNLLAYKLTLFIEKEKTRSGSLDIISVVNKVISIIRKNCECQPSLESTGEYIKYCYCL